MSRRKRKAGPVVIGLGVVPEAQIGSVVEIPLRAGARVIGRALRRADPLDRLDVPAAHRDAGRWYVQAVEHAADGRGLGPAPWAADVVSGRGEGWMPPQLRALSSAEFIRGADAAMGVHGAVVRALLVEGKGARQVERAYGWRNGRASSVVAIGLRLLWEWCDAGRPQKKAA